MNVTWWQELVLGYRLHYRQESGYRFDMDAGYRELRLISWIHHILGAVAFILCNHNLYYKSSIDFFMLDYYSFSFSIMGIKVSTAITSLEVSPEVKVGFWTMSDFL